MKTDPEHLSAQDTEMDIFNQVEAIFQFATEAILITNDKGVIIRSNPSAERLFRYTQHELTGSSVEMLIPARYKHSHEAHREHYNKNSHPRAMGTGYDVFGKTKEGTEFPVEVSLSPFSNSQGRFVIAFIVDISLRKSAEDQMKAYQSELEKEVEERTMILKEAIHKLEQIKEELDRSLKRERELNSMKSRFISIASHEFRTPLATVLSSLSLVEKYADLNEGEKRDKHIARIKSSIRNLTDILNDFLSLNKLEEGKVMVSPDEFDVNKVVEKVVPDIQGIAKAGQKIETVFAGTETIVELDAKLVQNILINLLSNAIKFSPEDSTITVSVQTSGNRLILKVGDQGIGIPDADKRHMFERFFRSSNAGEIQGTGLGLSIVLHYVNLMKGNISFESKENEGTTFIVDLPMEIK
jgi:PAS domain S-box-containing protein